MNGDTCLRQAYEAIFQGDFELALYWFQQAIAIDPDNASYYYKGSITCARSGKLALALTYAKKAVELQPDDPDYRLQLRMMIAKRRIADARNRLQEPAPNVDQCIEWLKEAAELDPLSAEAKLLLGIGYRLKKNFRRSLESLREALELNPQLDEAKRLLHEVRAERRRLLKQQYSSYKSKRNR